MWSRIAVSYTHLDVYKRQGEMRGLHVLYVDDIILLYNGNKRQIENFRKYINTIHHKLKFTLEIELNNSINFLDLTITKTNNTHTYKI